LRCQLLQVAARITRGRTSESRQDQLHAPGRDPPCPGDHLPSAQLDRVGDQRSARKHVISGAMTDGRRTRGGPGWAIRNAQRHDETPRPLRQAPGTAATVQQEKHPDDAAEQGGNADVGPRSAGLDREPCRGQRVASDAGGRAEGTANGAGS